MSLECVFKKHNRGRKRKQPLPSDVDTPPPKHPHIDASPQPYPRPQAVPARLRTPPPAGYWDRPRNASPERALFNRFPFVGLDNMPTDHDGGRDRERGNDRERERDTSNQVRVQASMSLRSMVHAEPWDEADDEEAYSEDDRTEATRDGVAGCLGAERDHDDHHAATHHHHAHIANGHHAGDPVSSGYISLEDARVLFAAFIKHFNAAMPIVDPVVHTHDVVREEAPFLYTVILCITSRYLSSTITGHPQSPTRASSVHHDIVVLARDHLTWAFAEAVSTIEVVQAVLALSLWKEPDDEKAAFFFNRAVILARELNLGRVPPQAEIARMSSVEKRETRQRQRLWLSLFSTNSIFHMQFNQPMLIAPTDPLVSTCTFWLKHAAPDRLLMDTFVAFSADLRSRYLHYRELLTEEKTPSALSLSVLTKSMNAEWAAASEAWIREIIDAGGSPAYVHKPRVWYNSLGLNLNLMILNQTLQIPPAERIPPTAPASGYGSTAVQLRSIRAFHHCLDAASSVLIRFDDLDKEQLTFASDTLLHFSLYAATFLWSLCRSPELYDFEAAEIDYTRDLILNVASTLDSASAYPNSSAALHAKYLRRLVRSQRRGQDGLYPPSDGSSLPPSERLNGSGSAPHGVPYPRDPQWNQRTGAGANANQRGGELDFLKDWPWVGLELPWNPVDESLFVPVPPQGGDGAAALGAAGPPPAPYANGAVSVGATGVGVHHA
ncbi:hypothetical protein Q8F55_007792 [Vanrija albida]|uniref:Xylanolytic transcriptional activator regulatory domain-containing protein n=1 Tax=Vanrija albida TaxID=181172 RepID=A0ABR3PUH8_9TREE